jgi:hypothetical protein
MNPGVVDENTSLVQILVNLGLSCGEFVDPHELDQANWRPAR